MNAPNQITRDVQSAELPDLEFDLVSRGYRVTERQQTPTGWRILTEPCLCPVCRECRTEREQPTAPKRKRRDPNRIVSVEQGKTFLAKLRESL